MMMKRLPRMAFAAVIMGVVIAASYAAYTYVWIPYSDNYILTHADPAMVTLADEAGMSRKGKLIFLRTDPQLVSDAEMQSACADNTAANNSNGFIEQGCYNTDSHRIYIRNMPADLHGLVVATASYEMLHPVYLSLDHSGESDALNDAIEAAYHSLSDVRLKEQVANFARTEPGARDLELFSLLGTGYSDLPGTVSAYYAPYFDHLQKTVTANTGVTKLFDDSQQRLTSEKSQINRYETLANQAYASSISWAQAGSQYWDDYYYGQYTRYVSQENDAIDTYNALLKSYNALVTEYNGTQPVKQLKPAATQAQ